MLTPYGDLPSGEHEIGDLLITVNSSETGWTESPKLLEIQTVFSPNDFIKLFTDTELIAIQSSTNPYAILGRTEVQTITTTVDLTAEKTVLYLTVLQQLGILTPARVIEIQSGIFMRS